MLRGHEVHCNPLQGALMSVMRRSVSTSQRTEGVTWRDAGLVPRTSHEKDHMCCFLLTVDEWGVRTSGAPPTCLTHLPKTPHPPVGRDWL